MTDRPPHATHHCRHYSYRRATDDWGAKCAQCMPRSEPGPYVEPCAWREEWTDDERAAWKAWSDERAVRMLTIIAQIPGSSRDKKTKPFWGKSGEFPCPACKTGTVRWARASVNGHMRAACTTPDCFGVIE